MTDPYSSDRPAAYTAPASAPYSAPPASRTNVLAIVSLIAAFVFAPAAIVCGHIALSQIKKTGEGGRGLALAGTVLGYVFTVLGLLVIIGYIALFAALASSGQLTSTTY